MNYTEEQINAFKAKADKWDALDARISKCYFNAEGEIPDDDNDTEIPDADLVTIGEMAAGAFGYL